MKLKCKQKESLKNYLEKEFRISPFAHAFRKYKNIATMALPHIGQKWIMCIDVKDFFPSINYNNLLSEMLKQKIKEYQTGSNYSEIEDIKYIKIEKYSNSEIIFYLTKINNYNNSPHYMKVIDIDIIKKINYLQEHLSIHCYNFNDIKNNRLPQGGVGSPFLSNLFLYSFDWRMAWICYKLDKCQYTRYADDIVISSNNNKQKLIKLLKITSYILEKYYFLEVNNKKTKIMHYNQRQIVCGLVVNEKLNLKKEWKKNLRAEIHQQKDNSELRKETKGRLAFQNMILNNKKESFSNIDVMNSMILKKTLEDY